MRRTIRFLARYDPLATAAMTGIFAIGGFLITLLTRNAEGVFYRYYQMSPVLGGFCLAVFALATGCYYANTALSMGATRRNYFWGSQAVKALCALVVTALLAIAVLLPAWCHTSWIEPPMSLRSLPLIFVFTLFAQELGGFLSFLASRRRWLLVLSLLVLITLLTAGTMLFLLARDDVLHLAFGIWDGWLVLALLAGAVLFAGLSWLPLAKYTVQ